MMKKESDRIYTGERFVPGIDDVQLELEHFQRYYSVLPLVEDKLVLDAACGEGYGSSILSRAAKKVTGIDICSDAVMRAVKKYGRPGKTEFLVQSVEALSLPDQSVDAVISFETIEHLPQETQQRFLNEIVRVLKKDGILVMSTPNKEIYSNLHNYQNEFHQKEFYKEEFHDFLGQKFEHICFYNQYFETAAIIDACEMCVGGGRERKARYRKDREYPGDGKYYLAVASNGKRPVQDITHIYLNRYPEREAHISRILQLQEEVEQRNRHLKKLDEEIEADREMIEERAHLLQEAETRLLEKGKIISEQEAKMACMEQVIRDRELVIMEQKQMIWNKEGHIELLLEVEREYERVKDSRTYQLAIRIRKLVTLLFPPGSKRRLAVKRLVGRNRL